MISSVSYSYTINAPTIDVVPGDDSSYSILFLGSSWTDYIETTGDIDWFRVNLQAGKQYGIYIDYADPIRGVSIDPHLRVWAPGSADPATGTLVAENDDFDAFNYEFRSALVLSPAQTGTYFVDVRSHDETSTGAYAVGVLEFWTPQQIASYLIRGYWRDQFEVGPRHFDVGADNAITVDISALSTSYQAEALDALQVWTDFTGIQFTVVTSGAAEITFTENNPGAYTTVNLNGDIITDATVNIETGWTQGDMDYLYSTFVHEIGHALGLGHAGDYNEDVSWRDMGYANDSYQMSIMSYFLPSENPFVSGVSDAYLLTPMLADAIAIHALYGSPTDAHAGNTVYGYGSNAGDAYNLDLWDGLTPYALTIVDSGGRDMLNLLGSATPVRLDLREGHFSDIMGLTGNLAIAYGTVIEDARGSNLADTIIGNGHANRLIGKGGDDTIIGGAGNDRLSGGAGGDRLYGGSGDDILDGGAGVDILKGNAGVDDVYGGLDKDWILGGGGNDFLYGNEGDDRLYGQNGNDDLWGGTGADRLKGHNGDDRLLGEDGNDALFGGGHNDELFGGDGNDWLLGGGGNDELSGEQGNDKLWGQAGSDTFVYLWGDGTDIIKDFEDNIDKIDFRFPGLGDPLNYAVQVGSHVKFDFSGVAGATDRLWVLNVTIAQLADDVVFL